MMKNRTGRLPPRDLEELSAYLDGELAPRARARLEARLQTNTELKQALEELRMVRGALRSLPQAAAPRRFTLTPEMAGLAPRRRRYPIMQLATVLAAAAFLLTVGVDALLVSGPLAARQLAAAPEALVMQEAARDQAMGAAELPPAHVAEGNLGGTTPAVQEEEGEAPVNDAGSLLTPTLAVGAAWKAVGTEVPSTSPGAPEALAAAPPAEATPEPATADEVEGEPPLPTPTAEPEMTMEIPAPPPEPAPIERSPYPWVRALEISLAGLTIILGGLTLIARRR